MRQLAAPLGRAAAMRRAIYMQRENVKALIVSSHVLEYPATRDILHIQIGVNNAFPSSFGPAM